MERCDHKSVGVIIENEKDETLLISRARFPFGWAAPAGHVDDHGTIEQTAVDEVFEETGVVIKVSDLEKVIDGVRVDNQCRRPGGDYHDWTVFRARIQSQELQQSPDETLGAQWMPRDVLAALAVASAQASNEAQRGDFILEPIWLDFFEKGGVVGS